MSKSARVTTRSDLGVAALVALVIACALLAAGVSWGVAAEQAEPAQAQAQDETPIPAPVTVEGRPEADAASAPPLHSYTLAEVAAVDGRQGIAWEDGAYYVSGSTTLTHYDAQWNVVATAPDPFAGFNQEVNHIGDIDVHDGEVYAGVEYFMDGEAANIQIAVYDAQTLELARIYPFAQESGQTEVSGIAVDADHGIAWMCSWADGESGRYLYRYDLATGAYLGKTHLQAPPQWIQGIAYRDGWLYLTADDGTADLGEPDHVYRCRADATASSATVVLERTLDDVTLQGEVEGISFDRDRGQMLVSYNRGAQIVLGMPKGFYEGYDAEVHEVFCYDIALAGEEAGQSGTVAASGAESATAGPATETLEGWTEDSEVLASLVDFVAASVDESSPGYIPPQDRIAVFDMDGTLIGERFPTYFNDWLYIQRALYDDSYAAPEELRQFAQRWEDKVLLGTELEDFDALERELGPKLYEGLTLEEYQDVVRAFKDQPVWGFEGMTYGEVFFEPMVAVVAYLYGNGYTVYIDSGTYRDAVRVMTEGTLDQYVPASQVIGTDLLFAASGQGDSPALGYTMQPEEDLVIAGELFVKNLETAKVLAIQREIGKHPVLAFGNSSGDFAMGNYALSNPNYEGRAYMLLCDDTQRDYGDVAKAEAFAERCREAGFSTISMRDDWTTIYGQDVVMVPEEDTELAQAA